MENITEIRFTYPSKGSMEINMDLIEGSYDIVRELKDGPIVDGRLVLINKWDRILDLWTMFAGQDKFYAHFDNYSRKFEITAMTTVHDYILMNMKEVVTPESFNKFAEDIIDG